MLEDTNRQLKQATLTGLIQGNTCADRMVRLVFHDKISRHSPLKTTGKKNPLSWHFHGFVAQLFGEFGLNPPCGPVSRAGPPSSSLEPPHQLLAATTQGGADLTEGAAALQRAQTILRQMEHGSHTHTVHTHSVHTHTVQTVWWRHTHILYTQSVEDKCTYWMMMRMVIRQVLRIVKHLF